MTLKLLGSAAFEGIPSLFCGCELCREARRRGGKNIRKRTSALLNGKHLIDFSSDILSLMLEYKLPLDAMEHVFITHSHSDHYNYHDIIAYDRYYSCNHISDHLNIYGNQNVVDIGRRELYKGVTHEADFEDKGLIRFHYVAPFIPFHVAELEVTAVLAQHMKNSARSEDAYNYIFYQDGKTLFYGMDSGYFCEETWEELCKHHFDAVVVDCTCGKIYEGTNHNGWGNVLEIRERMLKEKIIDEKTIFIINHFSHNGGILHEEYLELAKPYSIQVGYDGLEIVI